MRSHGPVQLGIEPPFVRPRPSLTPDVPAAMTGIHHEPFKVGLINHYIEQVCPDTLVTPM